MDIVNVDEAGGSNDNDSGMRLTRKSCRTRTKRDSSTNRSGLSWNFSMLNKLIMCCIACKTQQKKSSGEPSNGDISAFLACSSISKGQKQMKYLLEMTHLDKGEIEPQKLVIFVFLFA